MKHDWEGFGKEIATLIETRGNRGCRGCSSANPLSDNDILVTPHGATRLPLDFEGLPSLATRGNHKSSSLQIVRSAATPVTPATPQFRQGRTSDDGRQVPAEWHAILARLKRIEAADWLTADRWQEVISDTETLLLRWGSSAHSLGWTTPDLFGVHPTVPAARFDVMGLIPLIHGGAVAALTTGTATIRRPSGAALTYRRCDQSGAVLISEVKP